MNLRDKIVKTNIFVYFNDGGDYIYDKAGQLI